MFVKVFPKGRTETTKSTWIRQSPYSFRSLSKKSPPTKLAAPYVHINGFGDERSMKLLCLTSKLKKIPQDLPKGVVPAIWVWLGYTGFMSSKPISFRKLAWIVKSFASFLLFSVFPHKTINCTHFCLTQKKMKSENKWRLEHWPGVKRNFILSDEPDWGSTLSFSLMDTITPSERLKSTSIVSADKDKTKTPDPDAATSSLKHQSSDSL